jgi:hypothetical protein
MKSIRNSVSVLLGGLYLLSSPTLSVIVYELPKIAELRFAVVCEYLLVALRVE